MPLDTKPTGNFMSRFKENLPRAINAAGQMYGGNMSGAARLSAGINRDRLNRPAVQPNREVGPTMGGGAPPMGNPADMPIVQGPQMSFPFFGRGGVPGNTGIAGGMFGGGGMMFPRPMQPPPPTVDTGDMVNNGGMGGGLWRTYANMRRPMMSPAFG